VSTITLGRQPRSFYYDRAPGRDRKVKPDFNVVVAERHNLDSRRTSYDLDGNILGPNLAGREVCPELKTGDWAIEKRGAPPEGNTDLLRLKGK
jgi:hypothetical protein